MREYTIVSRFIYSTQGICAPQAAGGVTRYRIGSSVEERGINTVYVIHIPVII
jgi:hypothetical protein